ncbi:hypothetical protein CEUSTIGMA_g3444.t1 [Chlamydomonas eustigma]|uniref:CAAX prenyl protease 2/Lysostaphin resistance protein A-like domain-containing protein n=1 Tax=Chlamydomonas eustigma TaxID=1157962 RepID=A0A250WYT9_9CHLO|nr:hypothetical protein CEUSTIGMA_g3444.t1 [Chlamydomonas eustigma]|eukprot:GAX76001.1 hypothetical protein CEUSTIGMA_g3444.t1 [Chlamydomonas eustigma]
MKTLFATNFSLRFDAFAKAVVLKNHSPLDHACLNSARLRTKCFSFERNTPNGNRGLKNDSDDTGAQPILATPQPNFLDGINWYCYVVLGLIFVTDFTPFGLLIRAGASPSLADGAIAAGSGSSFSAAVWLAVLQWLGFVLPTLNYIRSKGWNFRQVLRLEPTSMTFALGSGAAGAGLWVVIASALAAKSGVSLWDPSVTLQEAAAGGSAGQSVLETLVGRPENWQQWLQLVLTTAVSPAVAEEVMFRGFLLTAILQRMGRVDAVLLAGALFSAAHLDPQQFFGLSIMGFAAGGVALWSGSVLPAIALHVGYNLAALTAGVLLPLPQ